MLLFDALILTLIPCFGTTLFAAIIIISVTHYFRLNNDSFNSWCVDAGNGRAETTRGHRGASRGRKGRRPARSRHHLAIALILHL